MIKNPSFEGQFVDPGVATFWSSTTAGHAEETAAFRGDLLFSISAYETFDHGWGLFDPQVLLTVMGVTDALPVETMDEWALNQLVLSLAGTAAVAFDTLTQPVEDFENGWGLIDVNFQLTALETEPGVTDDFSGWGLTSVALVSSSQFVFDAGGLNPRDTGVAYEQFNLRARQRFHVDLTNPASKLQPDHPYVGASHEYVTIENEGGQLPAPLSSLFTYVTHVGDVVFLSLYDDSNYADGHAPTIVLTSEGSGAHFIVADPGRFWTEELA